MDRRYVDQQGMGGWKSAEVTIGSAITGGSQNVNVPGRTIPPGVDAIRLANDGTSHWQCPPGDSHGIPRTGA